MKLFEVEYQLDRVNGYQRVRVQAYHASDACDIVRGMIPGAHVFHALLVD